jgi:hypothetical protein
MNEIQGNAAWDFLFAVRPAEARSAEECEDIFNQYLTSDVFQDGDADFVFMSDPQSNLAQDRVCCRLSQARNNWLTCSAIK